MRDTITIEKHEDIFVLRDDLLPGGTKSILLDEILPHDKDEFVYATPVYGGFQIALAMWCKKNHKTCILFCAKRKDMHPNTIRAISEGAIVVPVEHGYLSVVESKAKTFTELGLGKRYKIPWGSHDEQSILLIAKRTFEVLSDLKMIKLPDDIFIALGSGMITEGILFGTADTDITVHGVQVGAEYTKTHDRFVLHKYHKPFDKKADITRAPFPSMPNYDLKAWEECKRFKFLNRERKVLFWNVL